MPSLCRPSVIQFTVRRLGTRSAGVHIRAGISLMRLSHSLSSTPSTPAMLSLPKFPMTGTGLGLSDFYGGEQARSLPSMQVTPTLSLPSLSVPKAQIQHFLSASSRLPNSSCLPTSPVSPAHTVPEKTSSTVPEFNSTPFWPRPRGEDGRFVQLRSGKTNAPETPPKRCGWCLTQETSQWRLGAVCGAPDSGMRVLCNACGINFRRASAKRSKIDGPIDLDALARAMGPARPSIQKALKRASHARIGMAKHVMTGNGSNKRHIPRSPPGLEVPKVSSVSREIFKARTVERCSQDETRPVPILPSIQMLLKSIGVAEKPISDSACSVEESSNTAEHGY